MRDILRLVVTVTVCWRVWCDAQVWTCESIDETTGQATSTVDLSHVTRVNSAKLSVPRMTLAYGLYRFTLRVELGTRHLFDATQSTYVRVAPSPIVARIVANGMSQIVRGANTLITLSPEKCSVDPDLSYTAPQVYTHSIGTYTIPSTFADIKKSILNRLDKSFHLCKKVLNYQRSLCSVFLIR